MTGSEAARNGIILGVGVLMISAIVSNGSMTGRAIGGPAGCQATIDEPGIDITNIDAEDACDEALILRHPDSLSVIQAQVFDPLCVGCHQPDNLSGDLDLSSVDASYDALIDRPVYNQVARANSWRLVVPRDPERSFLLRKLGAPGVGEGAPMPPGEHAVAAVYQDLIYQWIAEGAEPSKGESLENLAACDRLESREDQLMTFAHPQDECRECHAQYVDEWQISSHAYAAKDPVFHAMVELGQRASGGKLNQFCVQCHSPVGMATGQTEVVFDEASQTHVQDLQNLGPVAKEGVSCDVCHSITQVMEPHNARMSLSPNGIRRATIEDPITTNAHASAYSELHESADLCSSCHAVTNPKGALIEETFKEWAESDAAADGKTCQTCHMPTYTGKATNDAPERELHRHSFAGVDVSLLPPGEFPGYDEMRRQTRELLESSADMRLTYDPDTHKVSVWIENKAGHALPSGATAERILWVEIVVRDQEGAVVFESGTLDEDGNLRDPFDGHSTSPGSDPQLSAFVQYMVADDTLATLTEAQEKADRRLELTAACGDIYAGQMPEGVRVVPFPWAANWQCNYMIPADEIVESVYPVPELATGQHDIEVRLMFQAFPKYFLSKLEKEASLDPEVKERLPLVVIRQASMITQDGTLISTTEDPKNEPHH